MTQLLKASCRGGFSTAFFECGWAAQYAFDHPEKRSGPYGDFVTIPINGVDWLFGWTCY